jgi:hypothetical protein
MEQWLTWTYRLRNCEFDLGVAETSERLKAGSNLPESCENSLYKHHAKMRKILGNLRVLTRHLHKQTALP